MCFLAEIGIEMGGVPSRRGTSDPRRPGRRCDSVHARRKWSRNWGVVIAAELARRHGAFIYGHLIERV